MLTRKRFVGGSSAMVDELGGCFSPSTLCHLAPVSDTSLEAMPEVQRGVGVGVWLLLKRSVDGTVEVSEELEVR